MHAGVTFEHHLHSIKSRDLVHLAAAAADTPNAAVNITVPLFAQIIIDEPNNHST